MNWPIFLPTEEHFNFHLQYKHPGTFANRYYEDVLPQKIRKCANPF